MPEKSSKKPNNKRLKSIVTRLRNTSREYFRELGCKSGTLDTNRTSARHRGLRTGMGLLEFLETIFIANENRSKTGKITDEEIARQIIREFPRCRTSTALRQWLRGGKQTSVRTEPATVNRFRNKYNAGRLGTPDPETGEYHPPVIQSHRYGPDGSIVNPRTGRKIVTKK